MSHSVLKVTLQGRSVCARLIAEGAETQKAREVKQALSELAFVQNHVGSKWDMPGFVHLQMDRTTYGDLEAAIEEGSCSRWSVLCEGPFVCTF